MRQTLVFICILGIVSGNIKYGISQKRKKDPIEKRLFNRKRLHADYLKNVHSGDTIAMDTIVIRYKRKDTSLRVFKYKGGIPTFTARIGAFPLSDSIPHQTMQRLIDSPIRVKDQQKNAYRVVSYRFSYKRKDVYLDDETMSLKIKYDFISYFVHENPLPEKHAKNLKADIKDGEEFWFDKIIIANAKGEQFFSPDIHIKTY